MWNARKALPLFLILVLSVSAFAPAIADSEKPLIGIIQIIEHPALDAAREGFIAALQENGLRDGENLTLDYRNAQGSGDILSSIADHFISEGTDLVLAIATKSAQVMMGKTETIPILGTAVTDYVEAGLAKDNNEPGFNVSGTTDMNPIEEQIHLLQKMAPQARKVGLLYDASEDNSVLQARIARELIEKAGMAYTEITVTSSNDVQQAAQSIVGDCDVLYIPTDNTLASAISIVGEVAMAAKVPVICGENNMVFGGGTAALGINYYNLGFQTGLMALDVLAGADVSKMPIQAQTDFEYLINKTFCDAIGLSIPEELQPFAVEVE